MNDVITSDKLLFELSAERKVAFYKKTYAHVAGAVLLFIIVESIFLQIPPLVEFALSLTQGYLWLLMLGGFMFVTNYAEKMAISTHDRRKQYIALLIYVVAEAFIFVPLLYMAIMMTETPSLGLIGQAGILALGLFAGLSSIVLITKKDFSFLKSIMTIGFFLAIGLIVAGMIFGFDLGLWFSVAMVALAAGSILYQTSKLVHQYEEDQYVSASLGLFASFMLLFWYLLSILSND